MEKILEIAKQLGEALMDHPIGQRYHKSQEALDSDASARQLLQDYEKAAMQIGQKERQGKPIEPEEKRHMVQLQSKLAGNDAVKSWLQAQVEYMDLLRQVNEQVMKHVQPAVTK